MKPFSLAKTPKLWLVTAGLLSVSSLASIVGIIKLSAFGSNYQAKSKEPTVKLQRSTFANTAIVVDIEGAVEKPGVYELPNRSRLLTALKKAGGLSVGADRYLIAKNFNLAKKLSDEEKIYLPFLEERDQNILGVYHSTLTNINTASISQLELLPGIGPARAQKIIDNRPYQQLEELITKKILGQATYTKLVELISL